MPVPALLLIALAVILWFVNKVRAAQGLEFSMGLPIQFRLQNAYVMFVQPIELINTRATSLTIQAVNLDFRAASGARLGSAYLNGFYELPALGRVILPVQVQTNLLDLIRAFPDLAQQYKARKLDVIYSGVIRAEGVSIPVSERFDLPFNFIIPKQ